MGPSKIKKLLYLKGNNQDTKTEVFTHQSSNKGLISKLYKALVELYKSKTSSHIKNWGEVINRNYFKEETKWLKGTSKCSASQII